MTDPMTPDEPGRSYIEVEPDPADISHAGSVERALKLQAGTVLAREVERLRARLATQQPVIDAVTTWWHEPDPLDDNANTTLSIAIKGYRAALSGSLETGTPPRRGRARRRGDAYIRVSPEPIQRTVPVTDSVNVDLDKTGDTVGVELLGVASVEVAIDGRRAWSGTPAAEPAPDVLAEAPRCVFDAISDAYVSDAMDGDEIYQQYAQVVVEDLMQRPDLLRELAEAGTPAEPDYDYAAVLDELADYLGRPKDVDPRVLLSDVKTTTEAVDHIARLVGVDDDGGAYPPAVVVAVRAALAGSADDTTQETT